MPWPPDNGVGRGHHNPGRNAQQITATNGNRGRIPDRRDERRQARSRLAAEHRRLGIARLAHQAMPLTLYYRHPKGGFYCEVTEGWWAA
jgi:hypothetical protein